MGESRMEVAYTSVIVGSIIGGFSGVRLGI